MREVYGLWFMVVVLCECVYVCMYVCMYVCLLPRYLLHILLQLFVSNIVLLGCLRHFDCMNCVDLAENAPLKRDLYIITHIDSPTYIRIYAGGI